jgi:tetratricopeptide (TPR) repeat protein
MKKPLVLAIGAVIIAFVLAGGLYWKSQRHVAMMIETHLPPPPSAKGLHPELGKRIADLNKRSIKGPNRVDSLAELSRLYHANGYLNRAWQNYRILIELDKNNPLWPYRLATIVSSFGHLDDSISLYQKAIEFEPEYIPSHIHLGDTLLKLNRYGQAKSAFQSVYDKDPSNPFALFGLARIALAQNDIIMAQRLLESARRSNNRIGGDLLADIYERLGETSKARALLHDVTWSSHIDIADPWVDEIVSDCYDSFEVAMAGGKAGRAGKMDRAVELLNKAIALDPLDHNAHNHLAETYVTQGNLIQARKAYENCIKTLPTFDRGWAGLISIELQSGNHSRASELIDQAIAKCPNSYVINNYKGEALIKENRFKEAIPYFETTIRVAPEKAVGHNFLARAYLNLRQNQKALEQLQKALKAEPNNPLTLKLTTMFYVLAGDPIQARAYLQKVVLSPRFSEEEITQLQTMFKDKFE